MKRNQKNLNGKKSRRDQLNEFDPFEQKKRRAKKFNKNMKGKQDFANQYEHELYMDNYEH
jgi:hypothetical protein